MNPPHVLILAAGLGKRMKSNLPKVLHPVVGRPMLLEILGTVGKLNVGSVGVVIGHGAEAVKAACREYPGVHFFHQKEQKGTGDAVRVSEEFFKNKKGSLLVLAGDVCLFQESTLQALLEHVRSTPEAKATVVTAELSDPTGYGRIIHSGEWVHAIKEHGDCSESERAIREVNSGIYCFDIELLFQKISQLKNNNRQGEYYLTDVIGLFKESGNPVSRFFVEDAREILGVNDRKALAEVDAVLRRRTIEKWWLEGVTIPSPETTVIDSRSRIGADTLIESNVIIQNSVIGSNCVIESGSRIIGCKIGDGCRVKQGCYLEESELHTDVSVGPYAHLRPGSVLKSKVKIGNFVEIKKSVFHEGAKASHLSYIGDAEIGSNTNLGCGFITCNYDGKKKSKTVIESDVFVGSDSQVIAPVTIGSGSYVASGTTVTENVPKDSLVISRNKQTTKPGYAKKYR